MRLVCKAKDKNKIKRLSLWQLETVHGKTTDEWHTNDIRVHTSDIEMTYEYIRVTYGWHTSTHEWHTDDIRVPTSDMRMTCEYIGMTYECHTNDMQNNIAFKAFRE